MDRLQRTINNARKVTEGISDMTDEIYPGQHAADAKEDVGAAGVEDSEDELGEEQPQAKITRRKKRESDERGIFDPKSAADFEAVTDGEVPYHDFMLWVNRASEADIRKYMKAGLVVLFPSGFMVFEGERYPGKLAAVLVQTSDAETVTDLGNQFYAGRKLSPEAHAIFKNHLTQDILNGGGRKQNPGEYLAFTAAMNKPEQWKKYAPQVKAALLKFDDDDIKQFEDNATETWDEKQIAAFYKAVGFDRKPNPQNETAEKVRDDNKKAAELHERLDTLNV